MTIKRVCAMCQAENGIELIETPGVIYSHGSCRRHGERQFAELMGAADAKLFCDSRPAGYWCPDMADDSQS